MAVVPIQAPKHSKHQTFHGSVHKPTGDRIHSRHLIELSGKDGKSNGRKMDQNRQTLLGGKLCSKTGLAGLQTSLAGSTVAAARSPPKGDFDANELLLIPNFAEGFPTVLRSYPPKIITQKTQNQIGS